MFTAREALRLTGLTYRQLDHTIRRGILKPSGGGGCGRGSPRRFTERDLIALSLARDVLAAGLPVATIAPALHLVQRGHNVPARSELVGLGVWTDGRIAALVRHGDPVPLGRRGASSIGYLLDLGPVARRLDATI